MRVAVVNDLKLAREILKRVVLSVPGYSVAWTAEDGEEAVERATSDTPDVILMDLVMPRLDGAAATRRIMARSPCPILLVTSSVTGNHQLVFQGMSNGGLDAVDTPTVSPDGKLVAADELLRRLERLARTRGRPMTAAPILPPASRPAALPAMVVIGASTGGPEALATVLGGLPASLPAPVVVVQHIAAAFAPNLVAWLQQRCALRVEAARSGGRPAAGTVSVAVSDDHLVLDDEGRFEYTPHPRECPFRPSVDAFFLAALARRARPGVAALLTGMGNDGARGMLALRQAGWHTVAQDRATSVVYGMPAAAADLGAACRVLPIEHVAGSILSHLPERVGVR